MATSKDIAQDIKEKIYKSMEKEHGAEVFKAIREKMAQHKETMRINQLLVDYIRRVMASDSTISREEIQKILDSAIF